MNTRPCSILKCILVWTLASLSTTIQGQPGLILTREYDGQAQEFWKPIAFQNAESSFAAVRLFFADGKDISLPKSKVGTLIFVPDLKTLQLSYDGDLEITKKEH